MTIRSLLSLLLLALPVAVSAQTTREHRIPLEVSPHSGTNHLCLRERSECDSIRRQLIRTQKAAIAARKAVCNYKPTGAISLLDLCTLITSIQRAALVDTTTY
jgi:hypothetical protein